MNAKQFATLMCIATFLGAAMAFKRNDECEQPPLNKIEDQMPMNMMQMELKGANRSPRSMMCLEEDAMRMISRSALRELQIYGFNPDL